ncbi:MAG: acetylornithine transaminase [Lentisphaeria bacterium]
MSYPPGRRRVWRRNVVLQFTSLAAVASGVGFPERPTRRRETELARGRPFLYEFMDTRETAELFKRYYAPVWAPPEDFVVVDGMGTRLVDADGRSYLDFVSGIAVNALGYRDPELEEAFRTAAPLPYHVSSLFLQEDRVKLAQGLVEHSFGDKVFFCNSGTEANEAAIKFARKWGSSQFSPAKHRIITFRNGFHGRSYGALSATAQEKFHHGFEPLVPGFIYLEPNDLDAFEAAADGATVCAVLVEPVQAEGGIQPCDARWLAEVRRLCTERRILLILDEIQTGLGRLGTLWGYQRFGVEPDIMPLAKAVGGGIPLGAVVMREDVAACLKPGDHGNTTGGSPVAARLGRVVLSRLLRPGFLANVSASADHLRERLTGLRQRFPSRVSEVRGMGLLQGLALTGEVAPLVTACRHHGLLVCRAGGNVLRVLPPLTVSRGEIDEAAEIIGTVLAGD